MSNSGRSAAPFAVSKKLQFVILTFMSLSLVSVYEIISKDKALNHYNDNAYANGELETNAIKGKVEDTTDTSLLQIHSQPNTKPEHDESRKGSLHALPTKNHWRSSNPSAPIRSWSCNLNETPIIFVHIGKAGGGSIRRRFASAAQNYTRSPKDWHNAHLDSHIYPFPTTTPDNDGGAHSATSSSSTRKDEDGDFDREPQGAKFCNSKFQHHRIEDTEDRLGTTFEGSVYCNATTPIGRMRACPEPLRKNSCLGCDVNSKYCHTVYVGHNLLGSEIHWLPPRILQSWWKSQWGSLSNTSKTDEEEYSKLVSDIEFGIETLLPEDSRWCDALERGRPLTRSDDFDRNTQLWTNCSEPLALIADGHFHEFWGKTGAGGTRGDIIKAEYRNYSPIYASLPVHRVTVMREPLSWLLSKYFWHKTNNQGTRGLCDDIPSASLLTNITNADGKQQWGWAYEYLMTYILYICGEDCLARFELGVMTLEDLEVQAESNLRQAFTVVGLLEEMDDFYDMVDQRFGYVNMTASENAKGGRHSSLGKGQQSEVERCKKVFEKEDFRNEFKAHLPVLAAMDRLYQVAVEVNRFQKEELSQCNSDL